VLAAKRLIDAGVFAVFAEHDHRVTQFKPPLILSDEQADEIIADVHEALA
jgi:acetylornithine/succinyldiaminopimelate/putrescine aminotransferase